MYIAIPDSITAFFKPNVPRSPPKLPSDKFPVLEGIMSPNTEYTLRTGASTSADALGVQREVEQRVDVLGKEEADGSKWKHCRLRDVFKVQNQSAEVELAAGTDFWIDERGLFATIAPWDLLRGHLAGWESDNASLDLSERITTLRRRSHDRSLPFDLIIGTDQGTEYLDDIQNDPDTLPNAPRLHGRACSRRARGRHHAHLHRARRAPVP